MVGVLKVAHVRYELVFERALIFHQMVEPGRDPARLTWRDPCGADLELYMRTHDGRKRGREPAALGRDNPERRREFVMLVQEDGRTQGQAAASITS